MIGYLLICYVDTNKISHSKEIVDEITSLINHADMVASAYTILFKNNNFDSTLLNFKEDVPDFLNDPIGMYFEEEDIEEDMDDFEKMMHAQKKLDTDDKEFEYGKDYIPLYIKFVSSFDLFMAFCDYSNNLDIYNCVEFYPIAYELSCLDQMEILRKLQQPQTDNDIVDVIINTTDKDKKKYYFEKFSKKHKN